MTGGLGRVRWGTDLITFFRPTYWGMGSHVTLEEWAEGVANNPRPYFDRMLDGAVEAGLEAIELAPAVGGWTFARQAYGDGDGLARALAERGLALGSSYQHSDEVLYPPLDDPSTSTAADARIDDHARLISACGADIIVLSTMARAKFAFEAGGPVSADSFEAAVPRELMKRAADQLNRLGRTAARHGVRIAIHTDAYSICSRIEDIATLMALTDPAHVLLCPDTGHLSLDGQDAVEILRQNIDRVPVMHWKDCVAPLPAHLLQGPQPERHAAMMAKFRLPGAGLMRWNDWIDVLAEARWSGWAMIEEDLAPNPVEAIRTSLEFLKGLVGTPATPS